MNTLAGFVASSFRVAVLLAIVLGMSPTASATCFGRSGGYDYIVWCDGGGCYGAARKVGRKQFMAPVELSREDAERACAELL